MQKYLSRLRNLLKNPFRNNLSEAFNYMWKELNWYYLFSICFIIFWAFMRLFLLFIKPDYKAITDYGERGTILIATLAILTFTYAVALELPEREEVTEIGKYFLKSVLNFVIGLIFLLGFRESWNKPPDFSVFSGILFGLLSGFLVILSQIILIIFIFTGLGMLIFSAIYLGKGIFELTKSLSK